MHCRFSSCIIIVVSNDTARTWSKSAISTLARVLIVLCDTLRTAAILHGSFRGDIEVWPPSLSVYAEHRKQF